MLALSRQRDKVTLTERETPRPEVDEALVRVRMAGICNTDLEIIRGYMSFEGVLGHEFVGVVEECADPSWLGARVAGEINLACHSCSLCLRGYERHCPTRRVLGILGKDGAFAEYLTLPIRNLHRVPDALSDRAACFIEPIAACCEILEQITLQPTDRVAVLGDGKLGTLAALTLQSHGYKPVLIGKHADKLARAKQLGIDTALELATPDQVAALSQLTPKSFDVVVEATGSPSGMQLATALARPRGTIVLKSTYHGELKLQAAPWVIDELTIVGSRCGPFAPALAKLGARQLQPEALIDDVFPLHEASRALARATEPSVLKVLLEMPT
jgi:threonine dehydrogenase-like Zn-dependent dehydrogenase